MGTRTGVRKCAAFMVALVLGSHLITIAESSKVWGEVPFPEDLEVTKLKPQRYLDDDEDFNADEASGDFNSGEDGSTPEPDSTIEPTTTIYYRAMVNFTGSLIYSPELDDLNSFAFQEISSAVVDTLESDYQRIPGTQMVNVVLVKQIGRDVFVELDVGSDDNRDEAQIREVLYSVVKEGTIGSYTVSVTGFEFRRLGEVVVKPTLQLCGSNQFTCQTDFTCIPLEYLCDKTLNCPDGSDENNCATDAPPPSLPQPQTTPAIKIPSRPGPCRVDQATCQNGECISRDYLCDGDSDCADGSDEFRCGTPSPCEPNEFKCQNGRCALKLWRCDGDDDCEDNSDEMNCPTKKPGDVCAPEQFACLSDDTCIPASYQCDEEPDCPDRSDEYGCAPPTVTSPPEESITAARGQTVTFTCSAVGVPTPIITWRLNWGHIPTSKRITMTSENGHGTLIIRDVKEGDQGAYTCEAINAKGLVFAIPDGVLTLTRTPSNCPDGHFNLGGRCVPCFCFGITKKCQSSGRYRNQISLRFNEEENFKGANVSFPSRPGSPPPLSSTQLLINPEVDEFQLVDLSRRFLDLESYWTLPRQFLGSKVDSYGGFLRYKVSYSLQRDGSEPVEKPDVILRGNGNRLIYRRRSPTVPNVKNHREIKFTEENWQHSSGRQVTREELLTTLANLERINIRTIYDNRMASVGLSDIIMDTTSVEFSLLGHAKDVEECRCPPGYSGLSCESCSSGFERVPGGQYLGTCAGCNCHGHASACDPVSGHCLSCQHNTEGPQCDKCRPGYFGDPKRGRPDDCKPCPCPYTESSRRFSDTCFLDTDGQTTCDACREGYTGRRCERCAYGYVGNPLQPNGQCVLHGNLVTCDNRGTVSSSSRPCTCKANVAGASCEECKPGSFHLSADNPDGCLQCFCMGVTKQCASSTWTREQVRGGINGQLFHLANGENTITNVEGISQRGGSEVVYRSTNDRPEEVYYWVLPENFQGDKVTAYGGVLRYKVRYEPRLPSLVIDNQPDVVIQGNGIFLEHFSQTKPLPRVPATVTVLFRESAWRRADGHPCTREHLLMALADIRVFMIRATYADRMIESSVADIQMDIAVPHSTGNERALEVEECACPAGYRGPSCQECDVGYVRTGSGLYLGTCERCECHGHASHCDPDTGACLQCQHNTAGPRCESCLLGFFGDPVTGGSYACRLCPCLGPPTGEGGTRPCYMDTDGHATCNCAEGHIGRRCERCAPGYTGNPELGQSCTAGGGSCQYCDERGSEGCGSNGVCRCKMNVEGTSCSNCKPGTFHLSRVNKDGCLACFCMGVTQQCSSSPLYRNVIFSDFASRDPQGFALVNRQRTNRIIDDFSVELSTDGSQLSYTKFQQHSQEPHFWQLPSNYQGDKRPSEDVLKHDDEIWKLLTNFSQGPPPPPSFSSSSSSSSSSFSSGASNAVGRSGAHASAPSPPLPPSVLNSPVHASGHRAAAPGRAHHHTMLKDKSRRNSVESSNAAPPGSINEYSLVYKGWSSHPEDVLFWQLPKMFHGDKVSAYGGKLQYTISYVPEARGAPIEDVDVQIIGNDITLVARQDWRRGQASRESRNFEIIFREEFWQRPDGMPATREHLLMVLADLDDVLIRATYHTAMRSSSISSVSMEIAVPTYTGLAQAVEVEQCRCPPGYRGLSCQDCAPGYTRTGGGLYLGHCEPCDCNSHSDSCHPETGVCTNCQHNTMGEQCDQCASGYFGDASAGTPEDCQPCACPDTDPENQFSPTCESLGNGDHRCTACQPGYTGQYCDRCAPGYVGNPQRRERCRPYDAAASLVVRVYPERVKVAQGSSVTLRCQGSGPLPHSFYWTRDDGRPIPSGAERRKQGEELHFSSVKASDAGVYTCTCRNQFYVNRSHAEIIITTSPSKPIEVSIEEPKSRSERPGATASFICTARSRLPAYTIVWTRQGNGKLPDRAVDFNGILTIQNVRPEDAGVYVCTGSNMLGMDEGTAVLHIPDASKAEMFYTAFEMFEGHRQPGEVGKPTVRIHPTTLTIQQGQRAELRCTATGNPAPAVEWTAGPGKRISSSAIIRGGVLIFPSVERSDQGDYTCRALNVHGEHAARAVLYVQGTSAGELVKPTVTIHPPALTVRPGQRAEFQCTTTGNPAPTVQWTGGPGNRISSSAIIRGGILIFPSVERSDQGDYTCRALNAHGEHAARAVLYVHGTSGDEVGKPSVTIHPPTLTIQQGRRAEFRCTATGSPTPTVEWTAGPGKRISSSATIRGGVLIFPSVERSDEGDYTCRALNIHGEHAARAVLYVHSASLPHVQVSPQQATIHEGETLRLYCRAGGTPSPGLTWKKRGGSLPPQAIPSYGFHQFKSNSLDALQRRIEELQARMERTDFGTLLIPSVKKSDSGTYLCIGTNDAGSSEAPIEVTVLPGDSESTEVSIYPSVASVAEGGTLELNCNVPGSPSPAVRWTRADRRPLSSNHQIIGTQLRILRASREDSGEYVCRVYIGPDVHQASVSVTVTRPERPGSSEVAIYPPVASVPEGGTLELNCNIPGRPPSSVRWSRADGRPLSSNHQIIGSQLRILRASREDAGDYICRVDEGSNVRQASISVTITRPEHPGSSEVGIYPPVASVPEGGTLELNCNIQGSPSSSVRWSRADGRPLSSNHQTIGTQLQILRASREDAGDYICTLYDGPNVRQASISVTITRPEHPGSSEVGVIPSVASVPEGGTLELNCNIPVSPSSTVRWTRADGRPLSSNHQIIGTQLRILRASQEDAGDYICTVYDGTNVRQATISVTITRPEHPGSSEIGVIPSVASVPEGGTLELNCNIPVSPSSTVRWTRADGRPLSSNHQIIGTQLRILRASREDAGDYICTVYDGTNVRQATISVTITRPEYPGSSEVGVIPSVASVPEGGTLELNCNIPVSPSSTVRWTRADGRPLSSNHQIIGTQLRILRASQEDAGDYICTVYDGTNVRQATISVTITRPERPGSSDVGIYRPVASVVEGGTLELNCNVQGSPSSSVRWSRADGRPLSSNHQTIGTQLRILRASREDAGDYICTVYDGPNVRQASISVTITRPEHPGSSEVGIYPPVASVPEGGTLELNCNIPGSPSSSVRWSRADGHPLSSNHQTIGTQLQILRASREDAGDYICTLYDGPNVRQASISVTITGPEHPGSSEVGIHHSSVTSVEGETLELNCVVSGSPPPLVLWRRADGRPLASNHQVSGTKLRIIQTSQEDSGKYICRISGGPDVLQASVSISSESTHPGSSEVSIYPSATSVVEGELLELTCNVAGDPPPAVVWSRADGRPLSFNHQVVGTQLRILRASPEDAGDYTCRVEGRPHHHNASVSVSISSESVRLKGPIISIDPHRAAVKIGDSARFKCRVHSGAQPIRLQWKLANNRPLPDNVRISPDGSVITITDAQVINQGSYHCLASNPFGMTDSLVSLVVRESPRAIVTPAGPVHVRVGDPINLECQASGEPRPSVTWHRLDNNRRTIMSSPVPVDSTALMQILVARPEDSGTYVCTAQNNQGRMETRVEVIVEGGPQEPTVPRASIREPLMVVVEGGAATLHCDGYGFPKPTITWSKLRSPLPWRHKIVNGSLVLPMVGRQDSGQYICNATNPLGTSEGIVTLEVETPPYIKMLLDDVAVRVGEVIRLQCVAHGTPPLRFEWTKVDGELSTRAEIQEGDLQINLASPSDAGSYKCVAKNNVGQSEAVAKVSVRSPLSVRVSPQVEVKALGSAVEFTCSASGGPEITLVWLKEGGALPNNHHIKDGVLRIENLEKSNEGMYICRASTLFGQAQDSAKLTIQALPKVMINVRTSVQTVMVGTAVEFECQAEGEPVPTLRWSKEGGPLPDYVRVKGGMLRIDRVTDADAGQYRCTATNDVGSVESKVVLNIQSLPQIVAHPETKEVTVGSTAVLPCIASGYPIPTIAWSKQAGELPQKCVQDGHALTIPDVTHEDSGTYVCTASNKQGKVEALTTLKVHERVMPYFSQEPLSYLTLPTIKNSYKEFKISVTFRPDNVDGMILYNGQKRTVGADFISLGLVGGRPEFRFDVGSGMATIRYPTAIKLGEFHTVQLYRNGTKGSIIVDGSAPINGTSQGKFQGLDLNEELFVGGYPNYSMIAKTAELNSGFVGCISQLIIQGEEVIFKDLDRSSTGVTKCPTCKDQPCQNGGVCFDSVASLYKCSCTRGFAGSNCQHKSSQHCHPEACGPDATCINRPSGVGYDCRCHLGKYGHKCMDGILVTTPLFDGDKSYIAYPPLSNIHNDLRIDLEFKPMDIDGLMFFSGGKKMKVEDFVTLSLVDSHVEFRYELGTGQAVLRSLGRVTLDQWHRVTAERLNQDGSLKLNDEPVVRRSSPGKAQGLNIHTPMYLGGVPSMDILPKPANVSMLFDGCIGEVSINGKKVDLSYSFTESKDISQCIDGSPCDRRPCQHGGTCMSTAEYEFQCLCRDGYEGERCEVMKDTCVDSSQCLNGGSCVNGHCSCPAGFTGIYCQQRQEAFGTEEFWSSEGNVVNDSPVLYAAHFHDDGYLTLPNPIFPRSTPTSPETIELEIKTFSSDGLILWEGVEPTATMNLRKLHAHKKLSSPHKQSTQAQGDQRKGKDFISLGVQNGHLVFSYQLGSGEAQIISRERISDGVWHRITAVRSGKQGYVQVDDGAARRGQSLGNSIRADTNGNMYLGGAPDVSTLTGGKFSSGVTGCLRNLSLMNAQPGEQPSRRIDLQLESGVNVQRCTS